MLAEELQCKEYKNGTKVSYEEYKAIANDFVGKCEYIDGKIYMFAGGTTTHYNIINDLTFLLRNKLKFPCKAMSEYPWYYDSSNLDLHVLPDISVICDYKEKTENGRYKGDIKFIIEVLLPTSAKHDKENKRDLYYNHGVLEYIIVDPELKSIEVFDFRARCKSSVVHYFKLEPDYEFISKVNENIKFHLKDIFESEWADI